VKQSGANCRHHGRIGRFWSLVSRASQVIIKRGLPTRPKPGAKAEEPGVESEELTALDAWISEIKAINLDAPLPSRGPVQAAAASEDLSKVDQGRRARTNERRSLTGD
jgi:hypothetical protein